MSDTPGNKTSNLCGDLIFTFRFDAPQHQVCRRRRSPWRPAAAFGRPRQNQAANISAQLLSEVKVARMKTPPHSRCCPVCGHRFIPWRVWQIGRWTCIRCPSCSVRLRACLETTVWLRCSSVEDPPGIFSFVAPRHPALSPKTAPLVVSKQALTRQFDWQCFAICFAICLLLAAVPLIQKSAWQIVIGVLGILLIAILDAATVRLRPAPP